MLDLNRTLRFSVPLLALFFVLLAGRPVYAHQEDHIVQPGETLSEIAQQYGTDTETLRVLNGLGNADLVWVGLRLQLPSDADEVASSTPPAEQSGTYTVLPGDSLPTIARSHRISLAHLVALNRISPAQRLYTGQILLVPTTQPAPSPVAEAEAVAPQVEDNVAAAPESGDVEPEATIHIVKAGEHLGIIAAAYEVSALQVSQANDLSNASLIVPGQRLIIPPASFEQKAAQAPTDEKSGFHVHDEFPTTDEKWIDVDLSEQRVVAYEGAEPVNEFIIASGKSGTPTVTGSFRIWAKTPVQDMYGGSRAAGDYYYLEDVQWVQYFFEDYAFHGTYWHTNFGTPQSRGCINMSNDDAKWLYDWAAPFYPDEKGWLMSDSENVGTLVIVHE